jgi:hypothetical protein
MSIEKAINAEIITSQSKTKKKKNVHQDPLTKNSMKKTSRVIKSCSKCQKRKVKCNFEIPCDKCIARNQAHLCTRDPVIYDGLLIKNNDKKELKFSQENEVLKKKIKELQDTIIKLKNENENLNLNFNQANNTNTNTNNNNNNVTLNLTNIQSSDLLKLTGSKMKPNAKKNEKQKSSNLNNQNDWNNYSITVSLLKKGLSNGMILDTNNLDLNELDLNTEEWLILNDKDYLKYNAEDSKGKCWQFELDKINMINKSVCDILINNGLQINILYPIINIEEFMNEYESYWSNKEIKEKHVNEIYSKSASNYIFLSLMYSLMCLGIYQCKKEDKDKLNFKHHDWDTYPKAFFAASLECLYRGRYMTHPNFRSIQTIILLRTLSGLLGGNTLSNNLTCVAFFLTYKLNLVKTNDIYKRNSLWNLLVYDWYDENDRYSLSEISSFANFQLPEKWISKKAQLLNWNNFYLLFAIRIATIKKEYYYNDSRITLESLKKADLELRYFEVEVFREMDDFSTKLYPEISIERIQYIQFHINTIIYHEILEVNLKMTTFLTYQQWANACYYICYHSACVILRNFTSMEIPLPCKSFLSVCESVIYASVFLLVDCALDDKHFNNAKEINTLTEKTLAVLNSFKVVVRGAIRGIYVIEKLKHLLSKKKDQSKLISQCLASEVTQETEKVENMATSLNVLQERSVEIQILNNANNNDNDKEENIVNKSEDNEESEEEDDDDNDDNDDDDDMPLYCSILNEQKEIYTQINIQKQFNAGTATQNFIQQPIVPPSFNDKNTIYDRATSINTANEFNTPEGIAHFMKPEEYKLSPLSTFTQLIANNINQTSEPKIHNKIMDILEDSGWSQFINSIDDLDMFDVK